MGGQLLQIGTIHGTIINTCLVCRSPETTIVHQDLFFNLNLTEILVCRKICPFPFVREQRNLTKDFVVARHYWGNGEVMRKELNHGTH